MGIEPESDKSEDVGEEGLRLCLAGDNRPDCTCMIEVK